MKVGEAVKHDLAHLVLKKFPTQNSSCRTVTEQQEQISPIQECPNVIQVLYVNMITYKCDLFCVINSNKITPLMIIDIHHKDIRVEMAQLATKVIFAEPRLLEVFNLVWMIRCKADREDEGDIQHFFVTEE